MDRISSSSFMFVCASVFFKLLFHIVLWLHSCGLQTPAANDDWHLILLYTRPFTFVCADFFSHLSSLIIIIILLLLLLLQMWRHRLTVVWWWIMIDLVSSRFFIAFFFKILNQVLNYLFSCVSRAIDNEQLSDRITWDGRYEPVQQHGQ